MSGSQDLTPEAFGAWRNHPVTLALLQAMYDSVEDSKEQWLNGNYTDESNSAATFLIQARQQERARVYREFLSMDGDAFIQFIGASK